jgi:hypothetical protein
MTATHIIGALGVILAAAGFLVAAHGMKPTNPNPKLEHWGYYLLGIGVVLVLAVSLLTSIR